MQLVRLGLANVDTTVGAVHSNAGAVVRAAREALQAGVGLPNDAPQALQAGEVPHGSAPVGEGVEGGGVLPLPLLKLYQVRFWLLSGAA